MCCHLLSRFTNGVVGAFPLETKCGQVSSLATAAPVFVGLTVLCWPSVGNTVLSCTTTAGTTARKPLQYQRIKQNSLHIGISGTTARKGEKYFLSRAKGPVKQWLGCSKQVSLQQPEEEATKQPASHWENMVSELIFWSSRP